MPPIRFRCAGSRKCTGRASSRPRPSARSSSAIPLFFWELSRGAAIFPDTTGWAVVLYAGIFPSLLSQVLYVRGVEMIGANRAGLFINAIPVFGTILSVVLVGETMHVFHIFALLLVLGGIAIAEWGRPKEKNT